MTARVENQDGIAGHADQRDADVMFPAQALGKDKGILCADGHDQAGGSDHSAEVTVEQGGHFGAPADNGASVQ